MKRTGKLVSGVMVWEPPFTETDDARHRARMGEMLRDGKPPEGVSDGTFLRGNWNQFADCPKLGDSYAAVAREMGVDPKGKVYLSGLAAFPGDPRAWVDSRGEIRRVLEERNWSGEGTVNVTSRNDLPPPPGQDVAEDLVDEHVERAIAADPGLLEKRPEDVREAVKERIKPHWKKSAKKRKKGG